jgi:hypothetical protein
MDGRPAILGSEVFPTASESAAAGDGRGSKASSGSASREPHAMQNRAGRVTTVPHAAQTVLGDAAGEATAPSQYTKRVAPIPTRSPLRRPRSDTRSPFTVNPFRELQSRT